MTVAVAKSVPMVRFLPDGRISMDTHDERAKAFVRACMYDDARSEIFIRGMFGSAFPAGWTWQRKDFLRRISDYSVVRQWVMARRTFGKTSLLLFEIVRALCLRIHPFILFTSNEQNLAEERTENIRTALITTPEIIDLFGKMRPQSVEGMKEVFGAKSWRLVDPMTNEPYAAVCPKSEGQVVNGLVLYVAGKMQRPTLVLNDDGEDRRTINNEDLRAGHRKWVNSVLMPCVDTNFQPDPETQRWLLKSPMDRAPYNYRFIDTNKHPDAYLPRLAQAPNTVGTAKFWDSAVYPIARVRPDKTFESLVPELISDAQVNSLHKALQSEGDEGGFWREYMCQSPPLGIGAFPAAFQYYKETDLDLNRREDIHRFIIVDPANTENPDSAFSSMLAVAVDEAAGRVYLRRQITERMSPGVFDETLFALASELNTTNLMVEGLTKNSRLHEDLLRAAVKRNFHCTIYNLSTSTGNVVDISGGSPKTAAKRRRAVFAVRLYQPFEPSHPDGHVWHEESMRDTPLEAQQHSYPECTWWDALDCLGHIPQAMTILGIVFDSQRDMDERKTDERELEELLEVGAWGSRFGDEW